MSQISSTAVSERSRVLAVCKPHVTLRRRQVGRIGNVAAAAVGGGRYSSSNGSGGGRQYSEDAVKYDASPVERYNKCDLVEAFCRLAVEQRGRPREDVTQYSEPRQHGMPLDAAAAAAATPSFPPWCEPLQSVDSYDVIDWSDTENDGWGSSSSSSSSVSSMATEGTEGGSNSSTSSSSNNEDGSSSGGSGGNSNSSGSSWGSRPGSANAATRHLVVAAGGSASSRPAALAWGGSLTCASGCRRLVARPCGAAVTRRAAVAACAAAGGSTGGSTGPQPPADNAGEAVSHYEGTECEALFPPGSLEMDDPGHPAEVSGAAGQQGDGQARVVRPETKPYMNIVGGRWVAPSKSEAEKMMGQLASMGPDEGV